MKSYIEPLNAADALDVLDLYGIDTPGAFFLDVMEYEKLHRTA